VVLQRVSTARVTVEGRVTGEIGRGLLLFQGVAPADTLEDGEWLAQKIAKLRVFPDDAGLMNRSVADIGGGILLVSQFTLFASTRKGTRPSFNGAAPPDLARRLYAQFQTQLTAALGAPVQTGEFGALMQVELVNDGPVTLLLDSKVRD
jgi:D-tyrosyl-tRNA(Tyr) deacylase